MLPAWCSARCCPPEVGVSCASASALFAVLGFGGSCDRAEKLQSNTGRLSQTSFSRPRIRLRFAERADISCVYLPFRIAHSNSMLLPPSQVHTYHAAHGSPRISGIHLLFFRITPALRELFDVFR